MRNKKAEGMWWIIVGAIIAIVILGVILFIVPKGLFGQQKNVDLLSSCKNHKGHCVTDDKMCSSSETGFYKLGCPETGEPGNTCCIPNNV